MSPGTSPQKNNREGSKQDLEVEEQRPIVDVQEVELHPFVEIDLVAAGHLPQACDVGFYREAAALLSSVFLDLFGKRRPGAHKTHIPFENVPKLGPLID